MQINRKGYCRPSILLFFISLFALSFIASASYADPVIWEENGHYYELREASEGCPNWSEARDNAENLTYLGLRGHLATITSSAENEFIKGLLTGARCEAAWVGGFQPSGSQEPNENWQWITAEQFAYTNWAGGEPNDTGDDGEDCLEIELPNSEWNDNNCDNASCCVLIEYEEAPTKQEAVPTLNQWGLIIFGVLMAGSSVWFIRKRKKTS